MIIQRCYLFAHAIRAYSVRNVVNIVQPQLPGAALDLDFSTIAALPDKTAPDPLRRRRPGAAFCDQRLFKCEFNVHDAPAFV